MNKVHAFAKVVLAAIGIFFAIRLIPLILVPLQLIVINDFSWPALGLAAMSLVISMLLLALLCYLFLHKREKLATWIVGTDQFVEPDSQIQWLPAVFRLICVAAGFYFLHTTAFRVSSSLLRYALTKRHAQFETASYLAIEQIATWLVTLAVGIYLICGAPHFVKWQVKKTLEQCKD